MAVATAVPAAAALGVKYYPGNYMYIIKSSRLYVPKLHFTCPACDHIFSGKRAFQKTIEGKKTYCCPHCDSILIEKRSISTGLLAGAVILIGKILLTFFVLYIHVILFIVIMDNSNIEIGLIYLFGSPIILFGIYGGYNTSVNGKEALIIYEGK